MQEALNSLWYDFCYGLAFSAVTVAFRFRFEGRHNVPRRGPALLVANHQSFLDPVLVGLATPRRLCFLARRTLFFNPLFGALIRSLNSVPVNQEGFAREGLRIVLEQLEAGQAVLIFPEGERTSTGQMQPFRPGIQLLIKRTRAAIVPVGVAGAFQALPRTRKLPRLSPLFWTPTGANVAVSIGRPLPAERLAELSREQLLAQLFQEVQTLQQRAETLRRKV